MALEDQWARRVREALSKYRVAVEEFDRAVLDYGLAEPDGSFAVQQARIRQSAALDQYLRVLGTFTELVMSGKVPEEDPGAPRL